MSHARTFLDRHRRAAVAIAIVAVAVAISLMLAVWAIALPSEPRVVAVGDTVSQSYRSFVASNLAAGDAFGCSVDVSGGTAVVGAPQFNRSSDTSTGPGKACVFTLNNGVWSQVATLTAPSGAGSRFGSSVSIDGGTILVGAPYYSSPGTSGVGAVYVFNGSGASWSLDQTLTAAAGAASDHFGSSVALSGSTAAIGALGVGTTDDPTGQQGAAYVFTKSATWSQSKEITDTAAAAGDLFGSSIAVSSGTLMVGAPSTSTASPATGKVCVYTGSGSTWTQGSNLSTVGVAPGDGFGAILQSAPATVVVGTRSTYDPLVPVLSATPTIRTYSGSGATWSRVSTMTVADGPANAYLGTSITFAGASAGFIGTEFVPGTMTGGFDYTGRVDVYGPKTALRTPQGTALTVPAPGVLVNDYDLQNPLGSLTATQASTPGNGTVSLAEDGSFVYTPNPGFQGIDTFTYKAHSAWGDRTSDAATVSIVVVPVYQFTVVTPVGGVISPSGTPTAVAGTDKTFTITPNTGYHLIDVIADSVSIGASSTVTFTNVQKDHSISASFARNSYKIVPTAGANGAISPNTTQTALFGDSLTCTFTPNAGYRVATLTVDGSSVATTALTYTFSNIAADHAIGVTFVPATFSIVPTAGPNGTISPNTTQTVSAGSNSTFTFAPSTGYHVATLTVDGSAVATTATSYTFSNVTTGHAIGVTFAINQYRIVPTAGPNGTISPNTTQTVDHGGSLTCTFTPNTGYRVATLTVDGSAVATTATSYTFSNVTTGHAIGVTFAINQYKIVPTAGPGGSISPNTTQTVDHGGSLTCTFTPNIGYRIATLTVDGSSVATTATSYTFSNVTTGHAIGVTFAAAPLPVTTISGVPAGWTSSNVTFTLSATSSALPVRTYYRLGASSTTTYTMPVGVSAEGTTVVSYWSVDGNGTEATRTANVRIDRTAPSVTSNVQPNYVSSATILVSAVDTMSGVASTWYSLDGATPTTYTAAIVVPRTGHYTLAFGAVDNAGNRSTTQTALFTVNAAENDFGGDDRYESAVRASASQFATGSVSTVVIATGEDFPDALSASAIAGAYESPVLLTRKNALPSVVASEVARLGARRAIIVGGAGVVFDSVKAEIESIVTSHTADRLWGSDRYGTAAVVAGAVKAKVGEGWDKTIFVATGTNYPDALSAGPNAYHRTRPILLVKGATIPKATSDAIALLAPTRAVIVGGTGVIPDPTKDAIGAKLASPKTTLRLSGGTGSNRYDTAVAVSSWAAASEGSSWSLLGVARGDKFADALPGGAIAGHGGGVMLLTLPTSLPTATEAAISAHAAAIQTVDFFGGDSAVSPEVRAQIMGLLP